MNRKGGDGGQWGDVPLEHDGGVEERGVGIEKVWMGEGKEGRRGMGRGWWTLAVASLAGTGTGPHYAFPGWFCRWSRDEPMVGDCRSTTFEIEPKIVNSCSDVVQTNLFFSSSMHLKSSS